MTTERVSRAIRLPKDWDERLVAEAQRRGISVNTAVLLAVTAWLEQS